MTLPTDLATLSSDHAIRIPKILIGNPGEQAQLAWDLIPNWRPRLSTGFSVRGGRLHDPNGRALSVPPELTQVLQLCDGRTFWDIVQSIGASADLVPAIENAAAQVKVGRVLGVLHWHFVFAGRDGCFLRRRVLGQPSTCHDWYYLSSFTKAVFDLCSGAYSCRQIAGMLASVSGKPASIILPQIVDTCRTLIHIGVVGWIDDEQLRAYRLAMSADDCPQRLSRQMHARCRSSHK